MFSVITVIYGQLLILSFFSSFTVLRQTQASFMLCDLRWSRDLVTWRDDYNHCIPVTHVSKELEKKNYLINGHF